MRWVPKNLLSIAPPCFVKPLVSAAFAVVSTHQSALGPRGGLWQVQSPVVGMLMMNRLMMLMMKVYFKQITIRLCDYCIRIKPGVVSWTEK
jgi:hypothetical protein